MSEFSTSWLQNNFDDIDLIIFDIGCADLGDSVNFRRVFPNAEIYAFECCNDWLDNNIKVSADHNINYFHTAVSNIDGTLNFYPSQSHNGIENWWLSGSTCEPISNPYDVTWGSPYEVESTRLDTFCSKHNISPDVIHIDVEGAEYNVLSCIGIYKPKCIWAEITEFQSHNTGITYTKFSKLMKNLGYVKWHHDKADDLYVLPQYNFTPYLNNPPKRYFNQK